MAALPTQSSPFFRLPLELRLMIYERIQAQRYTHIPTSDGILILKTQRPQLALLYTCHLIHTEAHPVLTTAFQARIARRPPRMSYSLQKILPHERRSTNSIVLELISLAWNDVRSPGYAARYMHPSDFRGPIEKKEVLNFLGQPSTYLHAVFALDMLIGDVAPQPFFPDLYAQRVELAIGWERAGCAVYRFADSTHRDYLWDGVMVGNFRAWLRAGIHLKALFVDPRERWAREGRLLMVFVPEGVFRV
jgi:hypothetical protein